MKRFEQILIAAAASLGALLPLPGFACDITSDHAQHWNELNGAGEEAYGARDLVKARRLFEQALAEADKQHFELERASTLNDLGLVYRLEKDYAKSESTLKEALSIREKRLGEDANCTGVTLNNLAELYFDQHRLELAETTYKRALKSAEHSESDLLHTANVLNNLGAFYYSQDRDNDAEPYLRRALEAFKKIRANNASQDAGVRVEEGLAEFNGDRPPPPEVARIKDLREALLNIYRRGHQYPRFREIYLEFQRDRPQFDPALASRSAHYFTQQAEVLATQGKRDDAEVMYNRALAAYEAAGELKSSDAIAAQEKYDALTKQADGKAADR
jgi:tetratricopeptide (TPR) repeat protein